MSSFQNNPILRRSKFHPFHLSIIFVILGGLWVVADNFWLPDLLFSPHLPWLDQSLLNDIVLLIVATGLLYLFALQYTRQGTASKQALEQSEDFWRAIFQAANDSILITDDHHRISNANDKALRTYRLKLDDLIGKEFHELQHAIVSRDGELYEAEHYRSDGSKFPVEISEKAIRLDGKLQYVYNIRDISNRKIAKEELERERHLFNTLMDHIPDAIYFKDREGRFLRANNALASLFGLSNGAEMIGKTDFDFHAKEHAQDAFADEQAIIANNQPVIAKVEKEIWPDRVRWVSTTKIPLHGANEQVIGTFGISRDISEMIQAEESLRENEQFLTSIFTCIQDGISVIDTDFNIIQANAAMTHWSADGLSLTGAKCYQAYHQRETPCEICPSLQTMRTGEAAAEVISQCGADGAITGWFELHSFPLRDVETGQVTGVIESVRNVTERKKQEDELRHTTEELSRSNAELQQFAYVASHDLQEPLRMVTSYVQLLSRRYKDKLDDDANDFISYAVDGATRMKTLINDLLTYSRVGTQGKPFAPTECNQVLERALANLQMAITDNQAVITHDPLPTVLADESQLVQLFQNLIGNAMKFHGEHTPQVHVSARQFDGQWEVSVRDNGIGIDQQYLERIFIIFQRLHNKEDYPGTGIGLAVCKKIVERHGGTIRVESSVGNGSTFYFTFPVARGHESWINQ